MSRGARLFRAAVFSILFLTAAPLLAAEGEGGIFSPLGWLLRWINTLILFGVPTYLLWKRAPAFFRSRAERIAESIGQSARAREEAEKRQREAEQKLASLDQEAAELRAAAGKEGAAEGERIRALAREEAARVERAAQAEIEAAERAARLELKAIAARLAVASAESLIRKQLTPDRDAVLFRAFVDGLRRSAN